MNEDTKKVEKKAEQTEQEARDAELTEESLDKVAGGASANTSRSNIKTNG